MVTKWWEKNKGGSRVIERALIDWKKDINIKVGRGETRRQYMFPPRVHSRMTRVFRAPTSGYYGPLAAAGAHCSLLAVGVV